MCSNGGSGVKNGPVAGGLVLKNEIYMYLKIFFSRAV